MQTMLYVNHTTNVVLRNLTHLTAYKCWIPMVFSALVISSERLCFQQNYLRVRLTGEASHCICLRTKFKMNLWSRRFHLCHKLSTNFSQEKPFSTYLLICAARPFFLLLDVDFINQEYIDCPDLQDFQMIYNAVGPTKHYQHVGTTPVKRMCKYR